MATIAFNKVGNGFTYQIGSGDIISKFKIETIRRSGNILIFYMGNDQLLIDAASDTITINGQAPTTNTAAAINTQLMTDVFSLYVKNNLNPHNAPTQIAGLVGNAAHFTAASQQALYIPSNSTLQGGNTDITIAAWAKFDTVVAAPTGVPQVIASKDDNFSKQGSEYYLGYYPIYGSIVFQVEGPIPQNPEDQVTYNMVSTQIGGLPVTGKWYFVVGWYKKTLGTVNLQIDNGAVDTLTGVPNTSNTTNTAFAIGSVVNRTTGIPECCSFFDGSIQNVSFWRRILTSAERGILYNDSTTATGLGAANGTTAGGVSGSADVPTVWAANVRSQLFNGTTGYISLAAPIEVTGLSVWFKANTFTGMIVGQAASPNFYIRLLNSTTIRTSTENPGLHKDFTVPTMNTSTWYHLIFLREADGTSRIFLNGVQSSSGGQSQPLVNQMRMNQIGRYWDGSSGLFFDGRMSEMMIFQNVLSADDIAKLYAGNYNRTQCLAYWKLNETTVNGTPATIKDSKYVGRGLSYANLPTAMKNESKSTFVSWWELSEASGVRYDSR